MGRLLQTLNGLDCNCIYSRCWGREWIIWPENWSCEELWDSFCGIRLGHWVKKRSSHEKRDQGHSEIEMAKWNFDYPNHEELDIAGSVWNCFGLIRLRKVEQKRAPHESKHAPNSEISSRSRSFSWCRNIVTSFTENISIHNRKHEDRHGFQPDFRIKAFFSVFDSFWQSKQKSAFSRFSVRIAVNIFIHNLSLSWRLEDL